VKFIDVFERDDHHVSVGIGIRIKNDVAILGSGDDVHLSVVAFVRKIAKDAPRNLGGTGYVGVSPGRPEVIHSRAEYQIRLFQNDVAQHLGVEFLR